MQSLTRDTPYQHHHTGTQPQNSQWGSIEPNPGKSSIKAMILFSKAQNQQIELSTQHATSQKGPVLSRTKTYTRNKLDLTSLVPTGTSVTIVKKAKVHSLEGNENLSHNSEKGALAMNQTKPVSQFQVTKHQQDYIPHKQRHKGQAQIRRQK
jgi:hypothetical protein